MTDEKALTIFVATRLVNPLNAREFRLVTASRAKRQREAVSVSVFQELAGTGRHTRWTLLAGPDKPKRITFTAHVRRLFDDDGLVAALKPIRDGLQDCGLIHHDGPGSGHIFSYTQEVKRPTGVQITVEVAP